VTNTRCTCILETQCRPWRISFEWFIDQVYHLNMLKRCAYKFQLKTNAQQAGCLSRFAGCCRLVWNKLLDIQKQRLDQDLRPLNYAESTAILVPMKEELSFLKEVHSQPLQQ